MTGTIYSQQTQQTKKIKAIIERALQIANFLQDNEQRFKICKLWMVTPKDQKAYYHQAYHALKNKI